VAGGGAGYDQVAPGLSPIADKTILGNISGVTAAPVALTVAEGQELLGVNFVTQTRTVSAPNATVPAHALTAAGTETNIDLVLSQKGTGGIIASVPAATLLGGNKRGDNAVDLQQVRAVITQVASGVCSVIAGGSRNTASKSYCVVGGGYFNNIATTGINGINTIGGGSTNSITGNTDFSTIAGGQGNSISKSGATIGGGTSNQASGLYSTVCGGTANKASGSYAFTGGGTVCYATGNYSVASGGGTNTAGGDYSVVGGGNLNTTGGSGYGVVCGGKSNSASSYAAVLGGLSNGASGTCSSVLNGTENTALGQYSIVSGCGAGNRYLSGARIHSSKSADSTGDNQVVEYTVYNTTANATPTLLGPSGAVSSYSNILTFWLETNSFIKFAATFVARSTTGWAIWEVIGYASKGTTEISTAFIGTPTVTKVASSGTGSTYDVAPVIYNGLHGLLTWQGTGNASETVKWKGEIRIFEANFT